MLNLDTHVLIHALRGDLKSRERALLSDHPWGIAAIVLWELAKLAQLGRVDIDLEDPEIESALASLHVWPLDLSVARTSVHLDFRAPPLAQQDFVVLVDEHFGALAGIQELAVADRQHFGPLGLFLGAVGQDDASHRGRSPEQDHRPRPRR